MPKIPVPQVSDFESVMGNRYVREREYDEIAMNLLEPPKEEEEQQQQPTEEAKPASAPAPVAAPAQSAAPTQPTPAPPQPVAGQTPAGGAETSPEKPQAAEIDEGPPFKPNDYLQKAEMEPPCDPEGNPTMQEGLMITLERIIEILDSGLLKTLIWIMTEKQLYEQKVHTEVKELQDKSVEELDENLRKQWPRKGRLEVEIYQQRKSEITAHNKKYERHVRA